MLTNQIFFNGKILTMDHKATEATAFGIIGDRFCTVGSDTEIRKYASKGTKVVDLGGKTVVPGFIESHSHLSLYAINMFRVDCSASSHPNIESIKARINDTASTMEPGKWIEGWGYDDTLIPDRRHLTRPDLDQAAPEHPVLVQHVSGHLAYANSLALNIAGISPDTPQPAGGEIHQDETRVPTGLLKELAAINLVKQHIPPCSVNQIKEAIIRAVAYYHRNGITSTHDAAVGYSGEMREVVEAYRALEAEGRLRIRVYLTIVSDRYDRLLELGLGTGFGSDFLRLGGAKLFQDGSIQAFTAALSRPYYTQPDHMGELIQSQAVFEGQVAKFHAAGLQIVVHANGDRAIESVIKALEKIAAVSPVSDRRPMIIHCQTPSDQQIQRMQALGVVASYFVNHVYYWGDRHLALFLGPERAHRIDPLRSSLKQGLTFTLHSDLPVTPVDPLFSIHCAVNRTTREGKVLGPEERVSALDALRAYTTTAAYCSFEENKKGSIEAGKLADFVVLSDNPLTVAPDQIKNIKVLQTVVGGNLVYEGGDDAA